MSKYSKQCGPNAIDNYDDYVQYYDSKSRTYFSRTHEIRGYGTLNKRCYHTGNGQKYHDYYLIESGITEMEDFCLDSSSIDSISLPGTLQIIGNSCFKSTRITSIDLPDSLLKIGHTNFPVSLQSLNIPPLIEEFNIDNIVSCTNLTKITVDERNKHYQSRDGILYNSDMTEILFCPNAWSGNLVVPNSVKRIGDYCFANCRNITSIVLPLSIVEIGNYAFMGIKTEKLVIRNNVKFIGEGCFQNAYVNSSFKFTQQVTSIPNGTFENGFFTPPFKFFERLIKIGDRAFANGNPNSFPNTISLPQTKEIGREAFDSNIGADTIELFSTTVKIGDRAFAKGKNGQVIRYFSFAPFRLNESAFSSIGDGATLVVPKGTKIIYGNATGWSMFSQIEEWDLNVDKNEDGEFIPVTDEIYIRRLKSIADSKVKVDRFYLYEIISELWMDYLDVNTDEEYEEAMVLINYNSSFSPAIVPDLVQKISDGWPNKYKLKLINKALIDRTTAPIMILGQDITAELPNTDIQLLPSTNKDEIVPSLAQANNDIRVFFNEDILKQLQNYLSVAQKSAKIAVSWFTNYTLFKQLMCMSESGIKIQLIINNDLINNGGYCLDLNQLINSGVEISLVEYPHLLHHKFCIIDDTVVISGSYNWTRFSAKNYENIIVIKDNEDIIEQFNEEFANILNSAEYKSIDKMPDQVPVRPEYDRSAFKQYITEELDAQARETSDERDKITALQSAAKLNPEYLERIHPEVKDKYAEAFKVVEDAAAIQRSIVAMVQNNPTSDTDLGVSSQQPSSSANTPLSSNTPPSGNTAAPSNVQPTVFQVRSHTITPKEAVVIQQVKASGLVMVLDVSGSMGDTYQQGHVHSITKKALSAAISITDTKEVAVWKFGSSASFFKTIGIDNIEDIHSIKCQNDGTELCKFVEKANSSILDGALVIIFTDDDSSSIQNAIPGMKNRPNVFWQIIVYGTDSTNISNAISGAGNTSVVSMTNYAAMDGAAISEALLKDYIEWKKAKNSKS